MPIRRFSTLTTPQAATEPSAWTREVSNAEYLPGGDGETDRYHVIDPSQPMNVTYVFGLDMMTIKMPEKLKPLLSMVAGGDISGITAWDLLLQLAERVSPKTEVTVKFQFDQNVDVDISNLTVSNDYFRLTSASMDENNLLTVKCNFIKQSQAIDPETANPICILSGVKMTAKNGANQTLTITNAGSIGYDIYLGANALYSMAKQTSFQEQYGIYPYEEPENVTHPKGGHFYCESYQKFTDKFILDGTVWSGWKQINGATYYFVDNVAVKGVHKVPGLNDESNEYFYQFNETTGACEGKVTGLSELDGAWYYAIKGVAKSGWWNLTDADGSSAYYFFSTKTFQAVDGNQKIDGYNYVFSNHKLVRGDFVKDAGGTHYRWAGEWMCNKWLELDGKSITWAMARMVMSKRVSSISTSILPVMPLTKTASGRSISLARLITRGRRTTVSRVSFRKALALCASMVITTTSERLPAQR